MGCFLGCFGGKKDEDRRPRRPRSNRRGGSPQHQKNRVQNVQQESLVAAEKSITETPPTNLVSELLLGNKPEGEEKLSPSPRKRVTFNSNVVTYEHVSVHESIESLPEQTTLVENEKLEDSKSSSQSHSVSEDGSVISSVASYPPNHRYHNARDSDDEAEEYGDDDLDDLDDELDDDDDDYVDDYDEDIIDVRITGQEVWSESVATASMESRTGNHSPLAYGEEVESDMVKAQPSNEKVNAFGSQTNARDRSDYVNSALNPVENITQWKAVKSRGTQSSKLQKENMTANCEAPRASLSSEPTFGPGPLGLKSKSTESQDIAVDASLSNWLGSSAETAPSKTTSFCGSEGGCTPVRSFEDRPILGALTVEELRQMSASNSPRKSPSRSPDEMPIIGTVGSYWNNSSSTKRSDPASSYKGIPNTTSKYREDKRVNWHSTPFETRLDRALKRETAEV